MHFNCSRSLPLFEKQINKKCDLPSKFLTFKSLFLDVLQMMVKRKTLRRSQIIVGCNEGKGFFLSNRSTLCIQRTVVADLHTALPNPSCYFGYSSVRLLHTHWIFTTNNRVAAYLWPCFKKVIKCGESYKYRAAFWFKLTSMLINVWWCFETECTGLAFVLTGILPAATN